MIEIDAYRQWPKRIITPRKLIGSVWWPPTGVTHDNFLPYCASITAEIYCKELTAMM